MGLFFSPQGGGGSTSTQVGKNYITYGDFETNSTTGWSLSHTTLSSNIPNQASGSWTSASGSLAISSVGSGQLAGNYSLQQAWTGTTSVPGDMLVSQAYSIDIEDQAKMLTFKFYYSATVGSSLLNFSGTSSNTYQVYIYDVTNSAWIQPAGVYNLVQSSGVGISTGTFQTPSNMTQFRIAVVCINASSSGSHTLLFDDFYVGPQTAPMGPAMSDWVAYTPTFGAGFGTAANIEAFWKRVGDSCHIQFRFQAGTVAGSAANISLPSGLTIASLLTNVTEVGRWSNDRTSATVVKQGTLLGASGGTTVGFGIDDYTGTANAFSTANGNVVGANSAYFTGFFRVPITGWSSSVVMSSDADTRVVAARANGTTGATYTSTNTTTVPYNVVSYDTHGAMGTSGTYTVPVTGYYRVTASIAVNGGTIASGSSFDVDVYVNGVEKARLADFTNATGSSMSAAAPRLSGTATVQCNAGDAITVRFTGTATGTLTFNNNTTRDIFQVERLSGPAVITATESVSALYTGAGPTGTLTNAYNTTTYGTKVKDTHNAYSGGTYTVPVSGTYSITARNRQNATYATGKYAAVSIYIDGVQSYDATIEGGTSQSTLYPVVHVDAVPLNAGQAITIRSYNDAISPTFGSSAYQNYFSIVRVGN